MRVQSTDPKVAKEIVVALGPFGNMQGSDKIEVRVLQHDIIKERVSIASVVAACVV